MGGKGGGAGGGAGTVASGDVAEALAGARRSRDDVPAACRVISLRRGRSPTRLPHARQGDDAAAAAQLSEACGGGWRARRERGPRPTARGAQATEFSTKLAENSALLEDINRMRVEQKGDRARIRELEARLSDLQTKTGVRAAPRSAMSLVSRHVRRPRVGGRGGSCVARAQDTMGERSMLQDGAEGGDDDIIEPPPRVQVDGDGMDEHAIGEHGGLEEGAGGGRARSAAALAEPLAPCVGRAAWVEGGETRVPAARCGGRRLCSCRSRSRWRGRPSRAWYSRAARARSSGARTLRPGRGGGGAGALDAVRGAQADIGAACEREGAGGGDHVAAARDPAHAAPAAHHDGGRGAA